MRPEIPHGCNGMGPLQRLGTEEAYPIYAGIRRRFFRNNLRRRPRSLPCFTLRFLYTSNRGGGPRAYCWPPVLVDGCTILVGRRFIDVANQSWYAHSVRARLTDSRSKHQEC